MVPANVVRAVAVASGVASVPLVYAALFVVGTMETLADSGSGVLLPAVVPSDQLPRANARLVGTPIVGNQLVAPPLGAALFVVAAAVPFGVNAAAFVLGALLIVTLRVGRPAPVAHAPIRRDVTTGLRVLLRHPVLRMLALRLCLMNVTLLAGFSILVLYARERLGLGRVRAAADGVGHRAGSPEPRSSPARNGAGLLIETTTHLVLALTQVPWVAYATLVVFGAHATVWGRADAGGARQAARPRQQRLPAVLDGRSGARPALGRARREQARGDRAVLAGVRRDGRGDAGGLAPVHARSARRPGPVPAS
ncbi:hypothetical protein BJF78_28455 [Pseudonocardia sp. CNS-139]|nr:hypothetical protein BJF78_28455 [Pseudonocardia sp. CNS-139]